MKHLFYWLPVALAVATPANATESTVEATLEYTDFTGDFGEREVGTLQYDMDFGDTTVVLTGSQGRREFEDSTFHATRGSVAVYHDWTDWFSTRTSAAVATDDPVFPTLEFAQDLNFEVAPNLVLLAGGKYTRYFGDRDAWSWSGGATYYFRGGFVSYRYTGYDVEGLGNTHGHLASLRLNDPRGRGFTQFWLGAGTAVQEYEALPDVFEGDYRSVAVRRVQPLTDSLALNVAASHAWYDTGLIDYEGTTVRLGLSFSH